MFRVALLMTISKYIGETEKNLGWIFEDATTAYVILFFDEADALLGKRTRVETPTTLARASKGIASCTNPGFYPLSRRVSEEIP